MYFVCRMAHLIRRQVTSFSRLCKAIEFMSRLLINISCRCKNTEKKIVSIRSSRSYFGNAVGQSSSYKCMNCLDSRFQFSSANISLLIHPISGKVDHDDQPNPPSLCCSSRGLHLTNSPQPPLNARRLSNRHRPPALLQNHRHMRILQNTRS